jgi:hypothetical protein
MHFNMKNTLKNNRNYTLKQTHMTTLTKTNTSGENNVQTDSEVLIM